MKYLMFCVLINCNSYINDLALNFSNPKTQIMVGIMELHDHLMFFILMIFILKIIFFVKSLLSATYYISPNQSKNILNDNDLLDIKLFNLHYTEANINNKFKNATLLEFIWTILPAVILILMAVPSFILLYAMEESEWPIFNISAIGNQWYWTYEYMDFDMIKYYKIFMKEIANATVKDLSAHIDYIQSFCFPWIAGYTTLLQDYPYVVWDSWGHSKREMDIFLFKIVFFNNLDEADRMPFESFEQKAAREKREFFDRVAQYFTSIYTSTIGDKNGDASKYFSVTKDAFVKEMLLVYELARHDPDFFKRIHDQCWEESERYLTDLAECVDEKKRAAKKNQWSEHLMWLNYDSSIDGIASESPRQRLPLPAYYKDISILVEWARPIVDPFETHMSNITYFYTSSFIVVKKRVSVPYYEGFDEAFGRLVEILDVLSRNNIYKKFKNWNWDISAIEPVWENSVIDDSILMTLKNNSHFFDSDLEKKLIWKYSDALAFCGIGVHPYISFIDSTYKDIEENVEDTLTIDCQIIPEGDLPKGYPRLLCTDQVLVIPSETPLRILVTSNDVIHSWSLPSFGIKMDGIPGRINQILLNTPFFGTVWGQCSELCGINHGFMPIELRVIGLTEFKEYINLMILNSLQELNKSFVKSHSNIGFSILPAHNNIILFWEITKLKRYKPIVPAPTLSIKDICDIVNSHKRSDIPFLPLISPLVGMEQSLAQNPPPLTGLQLIVEMGNSFSLRRTIRDYFSNYMTFNPNRPKRLGIESIQFDIVWPFNKILRAIFPLKPPVVSNMSLFDREYLKYAEFLNTDKVEESDLPFHFNKYEGCPKFLVWSSQYAYNNINE